MTETVNLVELARKERDEARAAYLALCRRPTARTAERGEAWRAFQEAESRYRAKLRKRGEGSR